MTDTWPTEAHATIAVDAAAKAWHEHEMEAIRAVTPPAYGAALPTWEEADVDRKMQVRNAVLPLVWAALDALPDPRYAAWEEGKIAGADDAMYEERGSGPNPDYPHENPYPSGV